jgi:polyphosphate kinase-like protein
VSTELIRWDVPTAGRLAELLAAAPPLGLRAGPARRSFHRDLHFDTPDGDLRRRGASCRLRFDVEDRRTLALDVRGVARCESRVVELEPRHIFGGDAEPARRLRAMVDPDRLVLRVELEVERQLHMVHLPIVRVPQFVLAYDTIMARGGGRAPVFHELVAWRRRSAVIPTASFVRALGKAYGLSRASADPAERATALGLALERTDGSAASAARQTTVLAVAHGRLALCKEGAALRLPLEDGGGEQACRRAMRRAFGNVEGEVRLLGIVPPTDGRAAIEVWLARRLRRDLTAAPPGGLRWFAPHDIVARVGSPVLRDAATLSALAVAARSELVPEWSAAPLTGEAAVDGGTGTTDETSRLTLSELRVPALPAKTLDAARPAADQFTNGLLSTLEFNARVLTLAEDPGTPHGARLRFLAIFSTNLDQFFMVDVGALKHQVAAGIVERSPDGLTPAEQLDAIAIRLRPLVARQYRCLRALVEGPLAAAGIGIRDWGDLAPGERASLAHRFAEEVAPVLTPKALTRAPGHPFPATEPRRDAARSAGEPGPLRLRGMPLVPAPVLERGRRWRRAARVGGAGPRRRAVPRSRRGRGTRLPSHPQRGHSAR